MLRIVVELLPAGDETRKRVIATAEVGNISGLRDVSDYEVSIDTEARMSPSWRPERHVDGIIKGHDRDADIWVLIEKVARLGAEG